MPENFKLYLDQMLRLDVAVALHSEGYDVLRASEVGQSRADDRQILGKAIEENRIFITLDEHFGDWVILPLSRHPGVIRLKVNPATSDNIIRSSMGDVHQNISYLPISGQPHRSADLCGGFSVTIIYFHYR